MQSSYINHDYPADEVSNSSFERIIVMTDTWRVVSSLHYYLIKKESWANCQNIPAGQQKYFMDQIKDASYGRSPSSKGSHVSVISVEPIDVIWWRPAIFLWCIKITLLRALSSNWKQKVHTFYWKILSKRIQ